LGSVIKSNDVERVVKRFATDCEIELRGKRAAEIMLQEE
jgi:hypothetical protein